VSDTGAAAFVPLGGAGCDATVLQPIVVAAAAAAAAVAAAVGAATLASAANVKQPQKNSRSLKPPRFQPPLRLPQRCCSPFAERAECKCFGLLYRAQLQWQRR